MQVRKMSISHLSKLPVPPTEKIMLGREYEVAEWFMQGVKTIASARPVDKYPIEDLAKELGWETVAKILWVRGEMNSGGDFVVDMTKLRCFMFGCSEPIIKLDRAACGNGHNVRITVFNPKNTGNPPEIKMNGRIGGPDLRPMKANANEWKEQISKTFDLAAPVVAADPS
jgi:hypothetical protein